MLIHLGLLFIWLLNEEAQLISIQSFINHIHKLKFFFRLEPRSVSDNER